MLAFVAGIFFGVNMAGVYEAAKAFEKLLNTEYIFVVAKKGVEAKIHLLFQKQHFYHIAGLHYLIDIQSLRGDRTVIFEKILKKQIEADIKKSNFYNKIANRVELLLQLQNILDSNDTVFHYNETYNSFSAIKAEYLLENRILDKNVFLFLDKNIDGKYFCRSFFPQDWKDYTKGQQKWTVLYKEKIISGQTEVLYRHKNFYKAID